MALATANGTLGIASQPQCLCRIGPLGFRCLLHKPRFQLKPFCLELRLKFGNASTKTFSLQGTWGPGLGSSIRVSSLWRGLG